MLFKYCNTKNLSSMSSPRKENVMAVNNTMYVLNERARFAYDNPNAAVAETRNGFVIYECAFHFHGIPVFSRSGIPQQHFPDELSLENHFRSLIIKDFVLAEIDRITAKARAAYGDASVIVRKHGDGFVIHHNEPTEPVYVFRSRPFERKARDVLVARHLAKYPTPASFPTLGAVTQYLDDRQARQAEDARMAEALKHANAEALNAFRGHSVRAIRCKRATDKSNFLLILDFELAGAKEHPFYSIEELMRFIETHVQNPNLRRRTESRPLTELQEEAAFSF